VKTWAAYVLLDRMLHRLGEEPGAELAATQAQKASRTLIDSAKDGILPAVMGEGVNARIIPAIEGLIYPFLAGAHDVLSPKGEFGELILTLQTHLMAVLSPGVCKFPDGGWRLSSSSRNSWLSKIYLCQFVSESILGFGKDTCADAAHAAWLTRGENAYYAWSDQMLEGRAVGSRYYPRGVTSILWLAGNCKDPINAIADHLGLRTPPFPA
jgi:xylan 1,4-beta-xylosidase